MDLERIVDVAGESPSGHLLSHRTHPFGRSIAACASASHKRSCLRLRARPWRPMHQDGFARQPHPPPQTPRAFQTCLSGQSLP
eukprot:scaffold90894_cov57-Phaeocystis_antarctica.AAC.2